MSENYSCCFTGYRPQKFPFPLEESNSRFNEFYSDLLNTVSMLFDAGTTTFYCGMAMGFDILAAEAVITVSRLRPNVSCKLIACIPFENQSALFPKSWKTRYNNILKYCHDTILISNEYSRGCYQKRNVFMVDNSDFVLTYFDGSAGGTKNTVNYAKSRNKTVINLFE